MLFSFCVFGAFYVVGEVIWDRTSHISMFFAGGIIGTLSYMVYQTRLNYVTFSLITCVLILLIEYIFGRIFNKNYDIWDYRGKRCNLHGQICLSYALIWLFAIPPIVIVVGNTLRPYIG